MRVSEFSTIRGSSKEVGLAVDWMNLDISALGVSGVQVDTEASLGFGDRWRSNSLQSYSNVAASVVERAWRL